MSKKDMSIHEKRLASFTRKRRASSAVGNKNAGGGKWPHERPSPQKVYTCISSQFLRIPEPVLTFVSNS